MRNVASALLCASALMAAPLAAANPVVTGTGLVTEAQAQDVFEVVSNGPDVRVRHDASGLICAFDGEADSALRVFPTLARGDDVACLSADEHAAKTIYATRSGRRAGLDAQMDSAVAMIRHTAPNAVVYEPSGAQAVSAQGRSAPQARTARFTYTDAEGQAVYTRVSIAVFEGWVFKLRFTAAADDADAAATADSEAEAYWNATLADIAAARSV